MGRRMTRRWHVATVLTTSSPLNPSRSNRLSGPTTARSGFCTRSTGSSCSCSLALLLAALSTWPTRVRSPPVANCAPAGTSSPSPTDGPAGGDLLVVLAAELRRRLHVDLVGAHGGAGHDRTPSGWVIYRYWQTRAMTFAQFFEMRHSRNFRGSRTGRVQRIINYGIFPAVAARFFIALCGLPDAIAIGGFSLDTFPLLMAVMLATALVFVFGGQIAVIVTHSLQGSFANVVFPVVIRYLLWPFLSKIETALLAAPEGRSSSTLDLSREENNIWYWVITVIVLFYGMMSWQGRAATKPPPSTPTRQDGEHLQRLAVPGADADHPRLPRDPGGDDGPGLRGPSPADRGLHLRPGHRRARRRGPPRLPTSCPPGCWAFAAALLRLSDQRHLPAFVGFDLRPGRGASLPSHPALPTCAPPAAEGVHPRGGVSSRSCSACSTNPTSTSRCSSPSPGRSSSVRAAPSWALPKWHHCRPDRDDRGDDPLRRGIVPARRRHPPSRACSRSPAATGDLARLLVPRRRPGCRPRAACWPSGRGSSRRGRRSAAAAGSNSVGTHFGTFIAAGDWPRGSRPWRGMLRRSALRSPQAARTAFRAQRAHRPGADLLVDRDRHPLYIGVSLLGGPGSAALRPDRLPHRGPHALPGTSPGRSVAGPVERLGFDVEMTR